MAFKASQLTAHSRPAKRSKQRFRQYSCSLILEPDSSVLPFLNRIVQFCPFSLFCRLVYIAYPEIAPHTSQFILHTWFTPRLLNKVHMSTYLYLDDFCGSTAMSSYATKWSPTKNHIFLRRDVVVHGNLDEITILMIPYSIFIGSRSEFV